MGGARRDGMFGFYLILNLPFSTKGGSAVYKKVNKHKQKSPPKGELANLLALIEHCICF